MTNNRNSKKSALIPKAEMICFILSVWVYAYFYQAGGWNQNSRFDLVRSLVAEGTHRIDNYAYNTGDLSKVNDHYYCDKAPGLSWLGVLPYYGFRLFFPTEHPDIRYLSIASYLVTVFTVSIPSALAVSMLYYLLGMFALPASWKILITVGYAFGTLAFPYATLFYGHQTATAFLFIAFTLLVRLKHAGFLSLTGIGILLGLAVSVDYTCILAVIPICFYAVYRFPRFRQITPLFSGILAIGIIIGIYHTLYFGSPFTLAYHFSTRPHRHLGGFMGIGVPRFQVLYTILFSRYRGLFYTAPWLIAGGFGLITAFVKKRFIPEMLAALTIIIGFCWLNASVVDWEGGWTIGPRYLIPLLPFLSFGTAGLRLLPFRNNQRLHKLLLLSFIVLIGYSSAMMLIATAVKPEVPMIVQEPFQEYLFPTFFQGMVALNTQSIDAKSPTLDGPFFARNLGQVLGFEGLSSLLPLGVGVILLLMWLAYIVRRNSLGKVKEYE